MVRQLRALGTFLLVIVSGLAAAQGIPSLRDFDDETRQSIEIACISAKTKGPAPYGACLNQQIASLQSSSGVPSLRDYDDDTRQSMELACISAKTKGPAAYGACLTKQIASLQSSPGIANLSRHDSETRHTMLPAPRSGGTKSDKSISGGTAVDSANGRSRFTTENIKIGAGAPVFDRAMLVLIFVFLLFYFLPTIVASSRKRHNTGAIFVLNLFLGWSLIGWVVSLVWAVSSDQPPVARAELPTDSRKTPWIGE